MIKQIGVFCGSSVGRHPAYKAAAEEMGSLFASRHISMIYGGGNIGLMGAMADTMLQHHGLVKGVIPESLLGKELAHGGAQEMLIVNDLKERKDIMINSADAFIVLPGGFGTYDELFEVITLLQLEVIEKPIGILNVQAYFDPLIQLMNKGVEEQFIKASHRDNVIVETDATALLDCLMAFHPRKNDPAWIDSLKKENRYL
ncbi:MAG: TIGR00730 family Rossman fold protein [Bacteroidales bacterium]